MIKYLPSYHSSCLEIQISTYPAPLRNKLYVLKPLRIVAFIKVVVLTILWKVVGKGQNNVDNQNCNQSQS